MITRKQPVHTKHALISGNKYNRSRTANAAEPNKHTEQRRGGGATAGLGPLHLPTPSQQPAPSWGSPTVTSPRIAKKARGAGGGRTCPGSAGSQSNRTRIRGRSRQTGPRKSTRMRRLGNPLPGNHIRLQRQQQVDPSAANGGGESLRPQRPLAEGLAWSNGAANGGQSPGPGPRGAVTRKVPRAPPA